MLVALVWVKLAGSGALPVGRALHDEGVGGGGEPVDRWLREQGVGGHGQPFGGFPVGGYDRRFGAVSFDDDLVEVTGLGGAEGPQREVVDDEDVDGGQASDLGVDGVVEEGGDLKSDVSGKSGAER